jgi:hypothetical protein
MEQVHMVLLEQIHRVLLVVVQWNSFDCPLLFTALCVNTSYDLYASTYWDLCGSITAFVSRRANDGI